MTVRSIYESQPEILQAIRDLHCPNGFECDLTYGNGAFWRGLDSPKFRYDIDPQAEGVTRACSTEIPHGEAELGSVVFDPPFLTYVRAGRGGNGSMIMSRQFGGYWAYGELEEHYRKTLDDCARVIRPAGVLVFKCQDIIHNHKMHCTHASVIDWAEQSGFRLLDLFILAAKHRLPSPNRAGAQKHARIFHSYFLVFQRLTEAQHRRQLWRNSDDRLEAAE
jgi:hypothetical protein